MTNHRTPDLRALLLVPVLVGSMTMLVGCGDTTGSDSSKPSVTEAPKATTPLFEAKEPGRLYVINMRGSDAASQKAALEEILKANPGKELEKTERFGAIYYTREDGTGNGAAEFTPYQLVYLRDKAK